MHAFHHRTLAAIAAASLLASFSAQANKGAEYHHKDHEHHKRFTVTGGATYLEPSFNGLDYLEVAVPTFVPGQLGTVNSYAVDPEFNWGYFLGLNYRISHHYDVQATWAQINTNSSDSETVSGVTAVITTSNSFNYGIDPEQTAVAKGTESLDYQVFDATLGQYHDITDMLKARIFAGLRYAKISLDSDYTYMISGPHTFFDGYNSSFSGVGPEMGLDVEYKIYEQLGVIGSLAAAFLIGELEANSSVHSGIFIDGSVEPGQGTVDTDDRTRQIPALNAKLGLNWEIPYSMHGCAFGVEAGYQVAYYFDVVDQVQYTIDPNVGGDVKHNYEDVGFMGPYLNFSAAF